MADLATPVETLILLTENGYRFWKSCNCNGTYWEKFKKRGGYIVKIAPHNDLFNVPALKIGGTISEFTTIISTLD